MTEMTKKTGMMQVNELFDLMDRNVDVAFLQNLSVASEDGATDSSLQCKEDDQLIRFTREDVKNMIARIRTIEYDEIVSLPYDLCISAISSGSSLGSCVWMLRNGHEKFVYVPAACGSRHRLEKELDISALCEPNVMLLTDLKMERDPLISRNRMMDVFLEHLNGEMQENVLVVVPVPIGVLVLELLESLYGFMEAQKQYHPVLYVSSCSEPLLDLEDAGAEWLNKRSIEKIYNGEEPFVLSLLRHKKLFKPVPDFLSAALHTVPTGAFVLTTYASLKADGNRKTLEYLAKQKRIKLIFTDPSASLIDTQCMNFTDANIEIVLSPIDSRLCCGDGNQLITRCCPENLLVPPEYLSNESVSCPTESQQDTDSNNTTSSKLNEPSHLMNILPLKALLKTSFKRRANPQTLPLIHLKPLVVERSIKFIHGFLDSHLAAQITFSEVNAKAVGVMSGKLHADRNAFIVTSLVDPYPSKTVDDSHAKRKRKAEASSGDVSFIHTDNESIDYREKTRYYLGTINEEKLIKRIKAHDSNLQVVVSEIGSRKSPETLINIPSLNAKITLWKNEDKSLIEAEAEEVRGLLRSFLLQQLSVIS